MAIVYSWAVTGWETQTEPGPPDGEGAERPLTVTQTQWTKTGTEGGNVGTFQGATPFSASNVPDADFVQFDDLTEAIVLGWIQALVINDYEAHVNEVIQRAIDLQKNPKVNQPMPWDSAPPAPPPE